MSVSNDQMLSLNFNITTPLKYFLKLSHFLYLNSIKVTNFIQFQLSFSSNNSGTQNNAWNYQNDRIRSSRIFQRTFFILYQISNRIQVKFISKIKITTRNFLLVLANYFFWKQTISFVANSRVLVYFTDFLQFDTKEKVW